MTPIADMVQRMMAAGVAAEMISLAVETCEAIQRNSMEIPAEKRLQRIREYDRNRKRNASNSSGIPAEPTETPLSLREDSKKVKVKKEIATGRTIPPDWHPAESHYSEGDQLGIPRQRVDQHAADMRLWAQANRNRAIARKADWDLTFSGWLRRNSQVQSALSDSPKMTIAEYHAKYSNGGKPNGEDHKTAIDRGGIESPNHASELFPPR